MNTTIIIIGIGMMCAGLFTVTFGMFTEKSEPMSEEHKALWEAIGNSSLEKQYPASEGWTITETPTGYIVSKPNTP